MKTAKEYIAERINPRACDEMEFSLTGRKLFDLMEGYAQYYHEEQIQPPKPTEKPTKKTTEKPIIHWLEELDEPERSQALENARNSDWDRTLMLVFSKAEAINHGFDWEKTPKGQGWRYWAKIEVKYRNQ